MKEEAKNLIIAGVVFVALVFLIYLAGRLLQLPSETQEQRFLVVNVTDGDTFEIATEEQVRIICVDTPEKGEESYQEAKDFLSSLILGENIRLEADVEDKDSYGRLLRYVYVNISGKEVFVNKEIVQRGYGSLFPYGNNTEKCNEIGGE